MVGGSDVLRISLAILILAGTAAAQQTQSLPNAPSPSSEDGTTEATASRPALVLPDAPLLVEADKPADKKTDNSKGTQSKRIFWIVPNYAAVNAHTQLMPLTAHQKFTLAMHDSVDYSSFVWAGVLAAQGMALKSYPELHQGMAGYSRYYWRAFADQASGAFFTEAIVPALTREDPQYYTLGEGNFLRRTTYALSQIVLTKTDSGGTSFNASEIVGNGMEASLANLYYPPQERGLRKTGENWLTGIESAALNNVIKEFWPDIRHNILRQK